MICSITVESLSPSAKAFTKSRRTGSAPARLPLELWHCVPLDYSCTCCSLKLLPTVVAALRHPLVTAVPPARHAQDQATAGTGSPACSAPGQAARPLEGRQAVRCQPLFGVRRSCGRPHDRQQGQRHVPVPAVRSAHLVVVQAHSCLAAAKACSTAQRRPATPTSVSRSQPRGAKAT